MFKKLVAIVVVLASAVAAQAEIRRADIKIFGMD